MPCTKLSVYAILLASQLLTGLAPSLLCSTSLAAEFRAIAAPATQKASLPLGAMEDQTRARALNDKARTLFDQGLFGNALAPARESLAIRERTLPSTHLDVATSLTTLGLIHLWQADLPEARGLFERALKIREETLGSAHPDVAESLANVGRVLTEQGDLQRATPILERALRIRRDTLGLQHPDVGVSLNYLSQVRLLLGDLQGAQAGFEEAITIFERAPNTHPGDHGWSLNGLASVRRRQGDSAGARRLVEKALRIREAAFGPSHPQVTVTLSNLVEIMRQMGEASAAIPLAERVWRMDEITFGPDHPRVALGLNSLAQLKAEVGDLATARRLREQALKIQRTKFGDNHFLVAETLVELARVRSRQGDVEGAITLLEQAIAIQESVLGANNLFLSMSLNDLGWLQAHKRNYKQAKVSFERALKIREQTLSHAHPDLGQSFTNLARVLHAQGDLAGARPLYERARQIALATGQPQENLDEVGLRRRWQHEALQLLDYAKLLVGLAHDGDSSATQDAFLVVEQARGWVVQAAVAKAMARHQAGSPAQIQLIRHVEDVHQQRRAIWNRLSELYATPRDQQDSSEGARLKSQEQDFQRDLDESVDKLQNTFPRYAELSQPKPIRADTVRALLHRDEALLCYYLLDNRLLVWVLRQDQPIHMSEVSIDRAKLKGLVQRVRESIGPSYSAFDVDASFELYSLLVGPFEPHLQGVTHLMVVPDEMLLPIPFAALVTDAGNDAYRKSAELYRGLRSLSATAMAEYAEIAWLAKKYAITVLPTASTLRLLRQQAGDTADGKEPLIGFGDPVLGGKGTDPGGAILAADARERTVKRLMMLNRLPGTRQELLAVAKALSANPERSVYVGARATESELRELNASGRLGEARVLYFATHGLLAGELQGVTQPALVLTPPSHKSNGDNDGLLTMDEVLQLKLPHTRWVILSACNTGSSDNSGEGLSGLARAFFYAGAKALLVSHWSVDDQATQKLMTYVFRNYGQDRHVAPAEAVRQGMLALLSESRTGHQPQFAHPYAWASFFLVGEGVGQGAGT